MFDVDQVYAAYVACAEWVANDTPMTDADKAAARTDVEEFVALVNKGPAVGHFWSAGQLGHDFFLTRNGHGAGFWDRYMAGDGERLGRELTDIAKAYGSTDYECEIIAFAD